MKLIMENWKKYISEEEGATPSNIKQRGEDGAATEAQLILFFKELYSDGAEIFKDWDPPEVKIVQNFLEILMKMATESDLHQGSSFQILQVAAKKLAQDKEETEESEQQPGQQPGQQQ